MLSKQLAITDCPGTQSFTAFPQYLNIMIRYITTYISIVCVVVIY